MLDFDGVVLNSWPRSWKIFTEIAKRINRPIPPEIDVRKMGGGGITTIFKRFFPEENPKELCKIWHSLEFNENQVIPLVEGVRDTFLGLKKRDLFLGILTNRPLNRPPNRSLGQIMYYWQKLNAPFEMLDFIQTREKSLWQRIYHSLNRNPNTHHLITRFQKPDPRVFEPTIRWLTKNNYIKKYNHHKKYIIFLGDSLTDLRTAKRINTYLISKDYPVRIIFFGVCSGAINTPEQWFEWGFLEKWHVIPSIAHLPTWLEGYEEWLTKL